MLSFYNVCLICLYSFIGTSLGTIFSSILFADADPSGAKEFERIYFYALSNMAVIATSYFFINYLQF